LLHVTYTLLREAQVLAKKSTENPKIKN
jgi:hypothetical protein